MRSFGLVCAFSLLTITLLKAQAPPSSTDEILQEAYKQATKENKNVFVIFHASWCGWCRKMDTAMSDKAVKKFFDDNYVIRHLVVYESKGKEKLENPGATDLLTKYKGNDQGIPYWLIFDKDGKLLADSKMRPEGAGFEQGDNSGCPASEKEVEHFINVLKKTSALNDTQLKVIYDRFRMNDVN
jgi:thiol-disulfide isomerase/thioredoxin